MHNFFAQIVAGLFSFSHRDSPAPEKRLNGIARSSGDVLPDERMNEGENEREESFRSQVENTKRREEKSHDVIGDAAARDSFHLFCLIKKTVYISPQICVNFHTDLEWIDT
jgi:hypothetical protein